MKICVGSWNIWIDSPRDYKGMAKLINKNKIDVIGVQEAAIYYDKKPAQNITEQLADELGYNFVFYPAFDGRPQKQWKVGNAILSKYPIIKSSYHKLNPSRLVFDGTYQTEQRILVSSKIKIDKKTINFLTTHLKFSIKFQTTDLRIAQTENIISIINKLNGPIILTGDFNSTTKNKEIKMLEKKLIRIGDNKPTWTVHPFSYGGWSNDKLKYRLDHILISEDLKYKNFNIIKSKLSDHLPIKADIIF